MAKLRPPIRILYHVTHRANLASILKDGLRPDRSRSRYWRTWLVRRAGVRYIAAHVAATHHWALGDMRVFKVSVCPWLLSPGRNGVYTTSYPIPPKYLLSAGPADSFRAS
jgi:RNA:NAD 2'-phosphotransferase (TPT1/KptA family)